MQKQPKTVKKTARNVAGLGAAAAMGLLAVALPGAAITAANAVPITPQPCAHNSVPPSGLAWLSVDQGSCASGSATVTSTTAQAGETVTFTVRVEGAGDRFIYGLFPVLIEDQDSSVASHTTPVLSLSEQIDGEGEPIDGSLLGENNNIFTAGGFGLAYVMIGGTIPEDSPGYDFDSDYTQTATLQFSATVAADAEPGSTFTVALGQPLNEWTEGEDELPAVLEPGITGCTSSFVQAPGTDAEDLEDGEEAAQPFGGDWNIVPSDTRVGTLCAEVTVVGADEEPAPNPSDTKKPVLANTGEEAPTAAFAALGGFGAIVAGAAMLTARAKRARNL